MEFLTLLFWFALLVPGFVVARVLDPRELKAGLPSVFALSMLATWSLLTPINIIGHVLQLPLWVMSITALLLVFAGLFIIVHRRWWSELRELLRSGASIEMAVLVVAMVLAGLIGSFMGGDAITHLSRIRLLLDHGLTNGHPFYGGDFFFPTYHTNLLHALMASCAQITGVSHLLVWRAAAPMSVLLIVSAFHYLGWTIFQRRWPAWVTALCGLAMFGSLPYLVYPNKLAPLWVMPIIIAFVIRGLRQPSDWRPMVMIAAAALVLGQLHGMYAIFAVMIIAPIPAVAAVLFGAIRLSDMHQRRRPALLTAGCTVALCIGMAFPLVSAAQIDSLDTRASALFDDHADAGTGNDNGNDDDVADAATDETPLASRLGRGFTGRWWRPTALLLAFVAVLVVLKPQRASVGILAAILCCAALWLYTPPLYALARTGLNGDWAVARLEIVMKVGFAVVVAGGAAALLARWIQPWWARSAVSVIALGLLGYIIGQKGQYDWPRFAAELRDGDSNRTVLRQLQGLHAAVEPHLDAGDTVVAPPILGMALTSVVDCRLIAAEMSNLGVDHVDQRKSDLDALIAESTPPGERSELITGYGIDAVVTLQQPRQWSLNRAVSVDNARVPAMNTTIWIVTLREPL